MRGLEAQLQMAVDLNLPVSFHVRDGAAGQPSVWDDFWPIFDNFHGLRGVLRLLQMRVIIYGKGFSRVATLDLMELVHSRGSIAEKNCSFNSAERLLLETDAPFLTPALNINKPEYVRLLADIGQSSEILILMF